MGNTPSFPTEQHTVKREISAKNWDTTHKYGIKPKSPQLTPIHHPVGELPPYASWRQYFCAVYPIGVPFHARVACSSTFSQASLRCIFFYSLQL
jgi:hypothetical protein